MPGIFISYRRADSDTVIGRIRDRLVAKYGDASVFLDIENIPFGIDFRAQLGELVRQCDVMLVIIGPRWLSRIQEGDWVKVEIEIALGRGIPIIPVLVNDAKMPHSSDLPETLRDLAFRNAAVVSSGVDFQRNMELLIRAIDGLVGSQRSRDNEKTKLVVPRQREQAREVTDESRELLTGLKELARGFFEAARRPTKDGNHPQLLGPDSIWIAQFANPEPREISKFSAYLTPGKRGFFIYEGALPASTSNALDRLRVEGKSIIPINANAMSAALADGNARALLSDLERGYESKDNLFDTRNALVDERFLFGRSELLTQVGSALSRGEHVLITGLRKCGKTSFLNILRQHLTSHPVCVVDLQRYDRHMEDWPSALFKMMLQSYDYWGQRTFGDWPATGENDGAPTTATELEALFNARRRWQIERGREDRMILIMDEAERIFPAEGETEEAQKYVRAAGALRVLGQSHSERALSIITADLHPWLNRKNKLADGSTNPFFDFFQEIPLPLLSHYAVGELVRVIGSAIGVSRVWDDYVDQLFALSGGHPSIARMIAGASYTGRLKAHELTSKDIDRGLTEMAANDVLGFFFRGNLWGLMTREEKETLRAAAERSIFGMLVAGLRSFIGTGKSTRYPEASANLYAQGILRNGRITIGSLQDWIREPGNIEA